MASKFIKTLSVYLVVFIFFTLIYVSSFHLPLFIHQDVLFYRGISLLILVTSFFLLLLIILFNATSSYSLQTFIAALAVAVSINLTFFVIFPVTFDRSVTMFLLNTLDSQDQKAQCSGLTKEALEDSLVNEYIKKQEALDRRIQEQAVTNFIKSNDNCVQITVPGRKFLDLSRLVATLYNL